MISEKKLAYLVFLVSIIQLSSSTQTRPLGDIALLEKLDSEQLLENPREMASRNPAEHVCVYREPYLRAQREAVFVNETVSEDLVIQCREAVNGVPLWNGSDLCKEHRNLTLTRTIWKNVYKTSYKNVKRCCRGWIGPNCSQIEENGCKRKCKNGGVCVDAKCYCTTGYAGDDCEYAICSPSCLNEGSCIEPNKCQCQPGWEGKICERAICSPFCQNQGFCVEPNKCKCPHGWEGKSCETALCIPSCLNDGVCNSRKTCDCKSGWTGTSCSEAVCDEGCGYGKCLKPNICFCPPGFGGRNCGISLISPPVTDYALKIKRDLVASNDGSEDHLCYTWGQSHYKTFDGKYFYFPGRCSYKLVADCVDDLFSVHVTNDPGCRTVTKCRRSVELYLGGNEIKIHLEEKTRITVNGGNVSLPHVIQKIVVMEVSQYVLVYGFSGITLAWDGHNAVYVHMPDELRNNTCGLCGNFNGNPADDLTTLGGTLVTSPAKFGNSYKMTMVNEMCPDVTEEEEAFPCTRLSSEDKASVGEVCNVMYAPEFSPCHSVVPPDLFVRMCEEDVCMCNFSSDPRCACDALTQYSRACKRNGVVLSWRKPEFCVVDCPTNLEYSECGSACPKRCSNKDLIFACNEQCIDGCHCSATKYFNGSRCVDESACPCEYNGEKYPSGSSIKLDCNECNCRSGKWNCSTKVCPGVCSSTGDPHYRTFDGKVYSFMGKCQYVLARDCLSSSFEVLVQNTPCGQDNSLTCAKSAVVHVNETTIGLQRAGLVTVNGARITIFPFAKKAFHITRVSSLTHLNLDYGLKVTWDGYLRLYVTLDSSYSGKTCGLCGNFNHDQRDDFLNRENIVDTNAITFGNSWKTETMCEDVSYKEKNPCEIYVQRASDASTKCGILRQEPFRQCHHSVDPEDGYIKNCEADVCGCTDARACYCSALADYAYQCARHGVVVEWRNKGFAPDCDTKCDIEYQEYLECGSSCLVTCKDLMSSESCNEECSPGCRCQNGFLIDEHRSKCVPAAQCSCTHDGRLYPAGDTVSLSRCTWCVCEKGQFNCTNTTCKGLECVGGQSWSSCGAECARTCENVHLPCLNTKCEEGCVCPNGLAFNGSRCIKVEECPCHYDGQSYVQGQVIHVDCNTCICNGTNWDCTKKNCAKTCSAYGDPHYITYDGRRFMYQGSCEYILTQDRCSGRNGSFLIKVQNIPCGISGVTCTKATTVILEDVVINMERGEGVKVTSHSGDLMPTNTDKYHIYSGFLFLTLTTNVGLTVLWDYGTRVYVTLDSKFKGTTCGLCGTFNDDVSDDFMTPQHLTELHANDFGDSWKVHEGCPDVIARDHPCVVSQHRATWSHKTCNIIRKEVFQSCHSKVDPQPYYEACYHDACGCDSGGDCECMCTAIAAYTRECNQHGIHIKWRTQELCPIQCEYGMEYSSCGPSCPGTCSNLCTNTSDCPVTCTEGCHCPPDKVLHNGRCIESSTCPCVWKGKEYTDGQFIISNCQTCVCSSGCFTCDGKMCTTALPSPISKATTAVPPVTTAVPPVTTGFPAVTTAVPPATTVLPPMTTKLTTTVPPATTVLPPVTPRVTTAATTKLPTTLPYCPNGMVFTECLPVCIEKCQYMNDSCTPQPSVSCTPGCRCSNDTVFNGTHCVNPAACPCFHQGNFRKPASRWSSGCNECICWHNKVMCQPKDCTPITYCPSPRYKIIRSNCCDICVPVPPAFTTTVPTASTQVPTTAICSSTEFLCETNGSCISNQWLCDGQPDCPGKEDEENCPGGVSVCREPLGVSDYRIPDSAISVSSQRSPVYSGAQGRLNTTGSPGWCAAVSDATQWFQVDFHDVYQITAVSTQGLENSAQYVTFFNLTYSINGIKWVSLKQGGVIKMFPGNTDGNSVATNKLNTAIYARYLRILPIQWSVAICLRVEIYGCVKPATSPLPVTTVPVTPTPCTGFVCTNGQCILNALRCDGKSDCPDGSDEGPECVNITCTGQFRCNDGKCVNYRFVCDNETDCSEGEDELPENCPTTPLPCKFVCSNGTCIPRSRVCDYFKDCPLGEDEKNCAGCPTGTWKCPSSGKCIHLSQLCNGKPNCPNGEDESTFCLVTTPSVEITSSVPPITTPTFVSTALLICVYNETTYQVGQTWWKEPCWKCKCNSPGNVSCETKCLIVKCPQGEVIKQPNNDCCMCVPQVISTPPQTTAAPAVTTKVTTAVPPPTTKATTVVPPATTAVPPVTTTATTAVPPVTTASPATQATTAAPSPTTKATTAAPPPTTKATTAATPPTTKATTAAPPPTTKATTAAPPPTTKVTTLPPTTSIGISTPPIVQCVNLTCACVRTCATLADPTFNCTSCKPGCQCPVGSVLHKGMCVFPDDPVNGCPCYHSGSVLKFGESFMKENCTICVCLADGFTCQSSCNVTCDEGYELQRPANQCCYCVRKVGVSTVAPITTAVPTSIAQTTPTHTTLRLTTARVAATTRFPTTAFTTAPFTTTVTATSFPTSLPPTTGLPPTVITSGRTPMTTAAPTSVAPITQVSTTPPEICWDENGEKHNFGDKWFRRDCEECQCTYYKNIMCILLTCPITCPPDYQRVGIPGKCCDECNPITGVPVEKACEVSGKYYKVGDVWPDGSCTICTCIDVGEINCMAQECIYECPEGTNPVDIEGQCCGTCAPLTTTAVAPSSWTGAPPSGPVYLRKCDVSASYTTITNKKGCVGHYVYSTSCSGYCESNATTLATNATSIIQECYCCRPKTMDLRVALMKCTDGSMQLYYYPTISSCECAMCGTNPIENQQNAIFSTIIQSNLLGK